jgi:FixJ family two-component response regulator
MRLCGVWLRRNQPAPVIRGLQLIADSFAAGAMLFLPKPFTTDQLQRALRIALSSRKTQKNSSEQNN